MKSILIVYAHPEKSSFNAALLDTAVSTLEGQGHKVLVSDLYAQNFNPVISRNDRTDAPDDPAHFVYVAEMGAAMLKGTLAEDIKEEQRKVSQADMIIFQFPMQNLSMPAIMKGWSERVFQENFSTSMGKGQFLDKGLLNGKKAVLSVTTGAPSSFYTPYGIFGDMQVNLYPIQASFRFSGLEMLSPNICFGPASMSMQARKDHLGNWSKRLMTIFDETPLSFPLKSEYKEGGLQLPEDYKRAGDEAGEYGASAAQHMDRKVPKM